MRETGLRQRYTCVLRTRCDHFRPSVPDYPTQIHSTTLSFADEFCGMLARVVVYVVTLALLVIGSVHLWDQMPAAEALEPVAKAGWSAALRSHPAFAVSQFDLNGKTETYEILRHPEGGRRDILRWTPQDQKAVAELEIYRPGAEARPSSAVAELAARMDPESARELEAGGVIDSKFGPVTLLRPTGDAKVAHSSAAHSCLGFIKRVDDPNLQISGWSCQGDALPARRAAIGCMLSRLVLLSAGNDPKLAELFARAELRRGGCGVTPPSPVSADWVTGAENPRLRGAF